MRDALDRFFYRHWPRAFLLALVGVLVAYGLWWVYRDYMLTAYPRQIAASIPIPPGVESVDTVEIFFRECKTSGLRQYFTSDKPWNEIRRYYIDLLQQPWQVNGESLTFEQYLSKYEVLSVGLDQISLANEAEYQDRPHLEQVLRKKLTTYIVRVTYNQDLRVYDVGGACQPED